MDQDQVQQAETLRCRHGWVENLHDLKPLLASEYLITSNKDMVSSAIRRLKEGC